ncbi:hypothetical protein [Amycolatopsis sp. WQ 127309]|uniref:hypothetical protein n=1 Tax=Amycolatopsis sp. WQ 127309 TaxID=2932773 RepID=UPI001FF5EDA6|nr:hypothetical protein [Amycolatopsis sp. WQ 127309]UOZ11099.1 hypothetical protein MUY22_23645 [Amycolatopsis sp. WQ 127309]
MKIVVLGATGLVGRAVVAALGPRHEIVPVSRTSPVRADLTDDQVLDDLRGRRADARAARQRRQPGLDQRNP